MLGYRFQRTKWIRGHGAAWAMIEIKVTKAGVKQMRDPVFRQKVLGILEEFREAGLIR